MAHLIQMVVFDMAGTTVDEHNVVYHTLHQTIVQSGLDISFLEVLRIGAGKEKKTAIRDILIEYGTDLEDLDELYQQFKQRLAEAYLLLAVSPMPGAETLFQELRQKNIKVVLNTGYDSATASYLLKKLLWVEGTHYDLLVCADMVPAARPEPDMIHYAMAQFGISDPRYVAKIGDSEIDIAEGLAAGCGLVLGITTGAHTESKLLEAKPNTVIHQLLDLLALI